MLAGGGAAAQSLPPLAVGGQLSHTVAWRDTTTGETLQNISLATLDLRSFIWQPWFVTVGTRFDLGYDSQTGDEQSEGRLLAGSLELGILPLSPIPTFFSWRRSDSRTDFEDFDTRTVGDFFTLTNRLTLPGQWNVSTVGTLAFVDQFEQEETNRGLDLSASKTFATQTVTVRARHRRNDTDDEDTGDEHDETNALVVSHQFRPRSHFNVNSTMSLILDDEETDRRDEERLTLQGFSVGRWRPPDADYSVTGTVRALAEQEDETGALGGAETTRDYELSTSLATNWRPAERLSLNAGVNALAERSEGTRESATRYRGGGNLSTSYTSLEDRLGGFAWSWDASGSLSGSSGTDGGQGTASAGLGHRLRRTFAAGFLDPLAASASQSVNTTAATDGDSSVRLNHGLRLSHSRGDGRGRMSGSLTLTDSRAVAGERDAFQLASFVFSSAWAFTRDTRLDGSISLQVARREDDDGGELDSTANGTLVFSHRDLLEVRNLDFTSQLRIQATGFPVEDSESGADDRRQTVRWSNRLDYRIGKLTLRLEGRMTWLDEDLSRFLLFRIVRAL